MAHEYNIVKIMRWVLSLSILIALSGCTNIMDPHKNQFPSSFYSEDSTQKESRALGNPSQYRVKGKNYYVMKSARHYQERGIASWYGRKFHSQRTSSGERYNMLAMTAAHRTLPLPTFVEVTNLKNGNKVIVKINDRGPFASNRLIDLSYVAAKKLGMMAHGTAPVEVKAIDPETAYLNKQLLAEVRTKMQSHPANGTSSLTKNIYVQVGTFKNRNYAKHLQKRLSPVVKSHIALAHHKKRYRIQIGPVKDLATANNIQKKLSKMGLTSTNVRV